MVAATVQKNKAYYSRYQVKFRRRREGKTDYRARLRLTLQDKNKFNTPKYRLCVRVSNRFVRCQVIYATIKGDIVVSSAGSWELEKYGIKVGLKNWAACYATGLLCARRTLKKFNLDETYEGIEGDDVTGEDYNVEAVDDGPRPFTCYLDIGLKKNNAGARVFGALKGACDGGLNVPHNEKRFIGYDKDEKSLDAEMVAGYIKGSNISEYMEMLEEEEPEKFQKHFSKFHEEEITAEDFEDMYTEAHEKIREEPELVKKARSKPSKPQTWKTPKLSYEQKKANLKAKLLALKEAGED
ncbi:hypothetical protein PPROV_000485600 [Pycnococcus provasolii]|uniref:Large ribosomal subunit protein uL18 C-terminal eukaryotes domain-containing protein n=1 Tax=Pycnococcus provasolii TaxID=41880 RepID=A0A830HLJ6_9CHLO|nr:hypothetical protein PPROV_000485600 [Pycnococcus provasolii]